MLTRKDWPIALTGCIFVGLFVAMFWLSPWPSYPNQNQQSVETQQCEPNDTGKSAIGGNQACTNDGNEKSREQMITDWWLVRIAGMAAVIAFVQLIFFWYQLGAMRKGLVDTARQAKIAEETFQKIERPYLFVAKMGWRKIEPEKPGGLEPGLEFVFTNGGKMPVIINSVDVSISRTPRGIAIFTHTENNDFVDLVGILRAGDERPIASGLPERFTEGGTQNFQIGAFMHRIPTDLILGTLYYRLRIRYSGPFTANHETAAAWEWARADFNRFGGDTYNYTT